jgi:hypothetical protein
VRRFAVVCGLMIGIVHSTGFRTLAQGIPDPRVFDLDQCRALEQAEFSLAFQFDLLKAQFQRASMAHDQVQMGLLGIQMGPVINQLRAIDRQLGSQPWTSVAGKSRAELVKERITLFNDSSTYFGIAAQRPASQAALRAFENDAASRRLARIKAIDAALAK